MTSNKSDVTAVMTSHNRPELLRTTLDSFVKNNSYPIREMIIIDDSCEEGCNDFVLSRYDLPIKLLYNKTKIGQVRSVDLAYNYVTTPWIFHMEEDWEFLLSGFIEASMEPMKIDPRIITVWLRSPSDPTLHHTYSKEVFTAESGEQYKKCDVLYPHGHWNGFTFNPSLKRLRDYNLVKPYQNLPRYTHPLSSGGNPLESDISIAYAQKGMFALITMKQYMRHIGWDSHVQ